MNRPLQSLTATGLVAFLLTLTGCQLISVFTGLFPRFGELIPVMTLPATYKCPTTGPQDLVATTDNPNTVGTSGVYLQVDNRMGNRVQVSLSVDDIEVKADVPADSNRIYRLEPNGNGANIYQYTDGAPSGTVTMQNLVAYGGWHDPNNNHTIEFRCDKTQNGLPSVVRYVDEYNRVYNITETHVFVEQATVNPNDVVSSLLKFISLQQAFFSLPPYANQQNASEFQAIAGVKWGPSSTDLLVDIRSYIIGSDKDYVENRMFILTPTSGGNALTGNLLKFYQDPLKLDTITQDPNALPAAVRLNRQFPNRLIALGERDLGTTGGLIHQYNYDPNTSTLDIQRGQFNTGDTIRLTIRPADVSFGPVQQ